MLKGEAGHVRADDELGQLAGVAVARVLPTRSDRSNPSDCYQAAYLAGLEARRSAERVNRPTSSRVLFLAMRQAVFRLIRRNRKEPASESELQRCA